MSVDVAPHTAPRESTSGDAGGFRAPYRPELEGLRAVAILLVAASHLWWGRISGGIDVFLVVSGYLITVTLVIRWVRTGQVGAVRYLRSLGARLIPAALLVLGTITVVTWLLLAETRPSLASDVLRSVGWSALFGQNWYLAVATDGYLSGDRLLNPAEHFWALSMQVQFYLVWLLVVALLALGLRRGSTPKRRLRMATTVIAGITLASWTWSVVETLRDQPLAYLDTSGRIWEFGAGALLALLGARLVPTPAWGAVLGWLGLAMVVGLGFLGDFDPWFPGIASVWPVLGTALVLIGGNSGSRLGAHRLLGSGPAVWLGGLAFGLYLWHWPAISALAILQNRREFSLELGLTIVLGALIAAWVMKRVLEQPWQRWGAATQWASIVALGSVLALAIGSQAASAQLEPGGWPPAPSPVQTRDSEGPVRDARSVEDPPEVFPDDAALATAVASAAMVTRVSDEAIAAADGVQPAYGDLACIATTAWASACAVGAPDAPHTAVLLGDSIAGSWLPALTGALGPRWRIVMATRGACPGSWVASYPDRSADADWPRTCAALRTDLAAGIRATDPDVVVLASSTRTLDRLVSGATGAAARTEWTDGTAAATRAVSGPTTSVIVLAPPPAGPAGCGPADFEPGGSRCRVALEDSWVLQSSAERSAAALTGASYLDTRDWFCTASGECPWALDGSVVRTDTHHLTAEFSARLAAVMRRALLTVEPELPDVGVRG